MDTQFPQDRRRTAGAIASEVESSQVIQGALRTLMSSAVPEAAEATIKLWVEVVVPQS